MGSFANSLHVRCADAPRVAAAIREVLAAQKWKPTEGPIDPEECARPEAKVRELHVSAPAGGWVSVLDSDLSSLEALTRALAKKLKTPTLLCFVDDSDSWSYQLAQPDGEVGVYDSAELADDEVEGSDKLAQTGEALQKIQALMQDGSIQQRMQQIQAQMSAAAPPEIRAAEARIRNRQATPADVQQYQAWAMQEMPKYMADLRSLFGGAMPQPAAQSAAPPPAADPDLWQDQLEKLRPLLAAGITEAQVAAVLSKQATFAEEVLAEFLPLVGINSIYANLSYDYLGESSPAELAQCQIEFPLSLKFKKGK